MPNNWIRDKLPEFVRDLFRNFCQACVALENQFKDFDTSRDVDFSTLRDLVGNSMDKGLLWRMKDTAHHVFRNDPENPLSGQLLDWAMGYIFHETMKLREDAYQKMTYAPWFIKLREEPIPETELKSADELYLVLNQTEESMSREILRIRFIMDKCRDLLPTYLSKHKDNVLLARFIFSHMDLVKEAFGDRFDQLLTDVYDNKVERMYVYASQSLRLGGWMDDATRAADMALKLKPDDKMALQEKKIIDNWSKRIKT